MKFLFDENISATLPALLADVFPDSRHVREVALKGAVDEAVWAYATAHGFALVSKDDDFREMSGFGVWGRMASLRTRAKAEKGIVRSFDQLNRTVDRG